MVYSYDKTLSVQYVTYVKIKIEIPEAERLQFFYCPGDVKLFYARFHKA